MRRLGTTDEVADFCAGLFDGRSSFQTGHFFSISRGWSEEPARSVTLADRLLVTGIVRT